MRTRERPPFPKHAGELVQLAGVLLRVKFGDADRKACQRWANSGDMPRLDVCSRIIRALIVDAVPERHFSKHVLGIPRADFVAATVAGALVFLSSFDRSSRTIWATTLLESVAVVARRAGVTVLHRAEHYPAIRSLDPQHLGQRYVHPTKGPTEHLPAAEQMFDQLRRTLRDQPDPDPSDVDRLTHDARNVMLGVSSQSATVDELGDLTGNGVYRLRRALERFLVDFNISVLARLFIALMIQDTIDVLGDVSDATLMNTLQGSQFLLALEHQ